ncbi:MAG: pyridoxal-phosphate-dependent aminotransferase family protein [Chthoniobacterales bacterium]
MLPHDKLFTPGPVEVSEKTLAAFAHPMIGHRGSDFKNLYREIHPKLQTLFGTKQPVFLSSSSAWGVMEASIRNLVGENRQSGSGLLCCMCGAFSDKWLDVARRCGKNAEPLQVDWGKHIDHRDIDLELGSGKFDTVTLIHNETSTGVMNPLPEICCTLAKYPEVVLIVDTVSSFSGMKIDMDALGIDVLLTGSQKALALPPGFSLFSVSEKAFGRAARIDHRGYYFDFLEFKKQQSEWTTPTTPSIGHIFALQSKLDDILAEGLEARYARHARTNALVHDWIKRTGFDFFAEEGFRSKTLTCVRNNKGIDVLKLARRLREKHHLVIDPGYGKLRGQTFRLSNMGDETDETVAHLLACLDDSLKG